MVWQSSTPEQKAVLITCLLMANHEARQWLWQGQLVTCDAGQFITSQDNLARASGVSRQSVRSALDRLAKCDFATIEATKLSTRITICNWATYQSGEDAPNQPFNQEPTNDQPRANQEPTTNKNIRIKELKNEKNKHKDFVLLSIAEYASLVTDLGEEITKSLIDELNDYIGAKGVRYKSHYHVIRNWAKRKGLCKNTIQAKSISQAKYDMFDELIKKAEREEQCLKQKQ